MTNKLPKAANFEEFRSKLKLKSYKAKKHFAKKYPYVQKVLEKSGISLDKIRLHSAKLLGAGALTSGLVLSPGSFLASLPAPSELIQKLKFEGIEPIEGLKKIFLDNIHRLIPDVPRPLTSSEEKILEEIIGQTIGIKTKANLEGEHLNTTYGLIGAEQHLKRFPGDVLQNHGEGSALDEGIAPGLGAWGYFSSSKDKLAPDLIETEKWYAVVQTLYLPDWEERFAYLRDWYRYRKVLIINTLNGNAVVATIADSGPAAWTGKHFGGSPEVMEYLGGARYKKGPIILFFVDDPENKVPLGPVEYNMLGLPENLVAKS